MTQSSSSLVPIKTFQDLLGKGPDILKSIFVIQPKDAPETFHLCLKAWQLILTIPKEDKEYLALRSQAACGTCISQDPRFHFQDPDRRK